MKIYLYDVDTKEYTQELETKEVPNFLSNYTEKKPPVKKENETIIFNDKKNNLEYIKDYRGKVLYSKLENRRTIMTELGSFDINLWSLDPVKREINIENYKMEVLTELSYKSKIIPKNLFPEIFDIKQRLENIFLNNFLEENIFDEYDKQEIKSYAKTGKACRDEFYRLKNEINKAKTIEKIKDILSTENFPGSKIL